MQVKKQQLEPEVEQLTGSKLGKEYDKAVYCHSTYLMSMQSSSYEMPDHKLESRLPGKISTTSDMQMTPPLWQKVKRNWRTSWSKWKGRDWKHWLKAQHSENIDHGIQSHHFMANRRGKGGSSDILFSWAPESLWTVTAVMKLKDACSWRKFKTDLDNILKSRDITLPVKVHIVKTMVFPVVMYGCESWTIKKAEDRRIDAFELWC